VRRSYDDKASHTLRHDESLHLKTDGRAVAYASLIPRLHDRANIEQTSSKRRANVQQTSSKHRANMKQCTKHSKHQAEVEQTSSKH